MDLRAHLAAIVAAMPPDGSVTLTVATLRDWMNEGAGESIPADGVRIDLTVEQVAEKLGRSPSTIRGWLSADRLPGAYRLRGREWRIPPATFQAFLQREAAEGAKATRHRGDNAPVRLDSWRAYMTEGSAKR